MRIDPYIGGGQVQPMHQQSTSTEVKFIKSIEKIDNHIAKRNATTTLDREQGVHRQHRQQGTMIILEDNIAKKNP